MTTTTTTTISLLCPLSANELITVWDLELRGGDATEESAMQWMVNWPSFCAETSSAGFQGLLTIGIFFKSLFFNTNYLVFLGGNTRHKLTRQQVESTCGRCWPCRPCRPWPGASAATALDAQQRFHATTQREPVKRVGELSKVETKNWNLPKFPNKFCLSILWHDNWSHWVFSNWISVSFRLSITREMKRTNSMPKRFGSTSRDATRNGAAAWYRVVRMIIFHNVIMYSGFKHIECIDL